MIRVAGLGVAEEVFFPLFGSLEQPLLPFTDTLTKSNKSKKNVI